MESSTLYHTEAGTPQREIRTVEGFQAADLPIRYHIKIQGEAAPYDPGYVECFDKRKNGRKMAQEIWNDQKSTQQSKQKITRLNKTLGSK